MAELARKTELPGTRSTLTADQPGTIRKFEADKTEWDRIAGTHEFQDLMATKKVFIIPAFLFFLAYYFALPLLVGYAPNFMATKVIGPVNIAYLFALSQFFMAWIIAFLYVKAADDFDKLARDIIEKAENHPNNQQNGTKGGR